MKVKDLDNKANLLGMKIKLTPELKKAYENYSSKGEEIVYLVGQFMGDWFISPQAPGNKGSRSLYPMPIEVEPKDFLECEIIE